MSSRRDKYVNYLNAFSPAAAKHTIIFFITGLIFLEIFWRGFSPAYVRTALSSLHGIRTIHQQLGDSRKNKIIGVGDSTLLGGGVNSNANTFMGYLSYELNSKKPNFDVFNLAVPGGDTATSLLLLDSIRMSEIKAIDRVIIEVIPFKFFSYDSNPILKSSSLATITELQNFVPFIRPELFGLDVPTVSYIKKIEAYAQWWLGNISSLYRNRDFFRTEIVGNYPIYWLINNVLPRSLINKVFPAKSQGLNRLAAHADDFPFSHENIKKSPHTKPDNFAKFTPHDQGDYLEKAIAIAKNISAKPPIIIAFPIHYEYDSPDEAHKSSILSALAEFENYVNNISQKTGSELIFIDSKAFQSPDLWTRSIAHFNASAHRKIWKAAKKQLCQSYGIN
jgi:hypothetical protein